MFPDFKDLLSALNAHRVRYLVVGGYAVSFHAQPRATRDLDLLISTDAENGRAVYAALAAFGAPLEGFTARDLVEPGSFLRMGSQAQIPPGASDEPNKERSSELRGAELTKGLDAGLEDEPEA